jgi:hypothetical protein
LENSFRFALWRRKCYVFTESGGCPHPWKPNVEQ